MVSRDVGFRSVIGQRVRLLTSRLRVQVPPVAWLYSVVGYHIAL